MGSTWRCVMLSEHIWEINSLQSYCPLPWLLTTHDRPPCHFVETDTALRNNADLMQVTSRDDLFWPYSLSFFLFCNHFNMFIFFHHGLSQDIEYSSLCYRAGPCCLSILNVIVCIYQPQIPSPSLSLPLGNHKSVLYVCEFVSVL